MSQFKSTYPASTLLGEGFHHVGKAVFQHDGVVVEELLESVFLVMDLEGVGQKRVPVVESVEFGCNAVLVLKSLVEQQLRIELEFEVVAAQVLHIVLDNDLDCLSCWPVKQKIILVLVP